MDDKSIINATPTKDLFISMLIRDVTLRDAIGDLVDNCIDGAQRLRPDGNYEGLYVDIDLDIHKGVFSITDNCGGISVEIAREYAFRFGRPDFYKLHKDHSVGVFGIGMKRALFKLGKYFAINSIAKDSSFELNVDVDKWRNEQPDTMEGWTFRFTKFEENLKKDYPPEKRGTKIVVTELNEDVFRSFSSDQDIQKLIDEIEREHIYSIDKGLKIRINKKPLKASQLKILMSDKITPGIWQKSEGKVKIKIIVGISEQEKYGPNGGWYVFCNQRLILGPDQTKITGWGVRSPIRIPEYHPQFYRFRGFVFLDADDPRELPWNTAKTNMDLDSPLYRGILAQMITMMRIVIDFLNGLHDEKSDLQKGIISETPLQDAIDNTHSLNLNDYIQKNKKKTNNIFIYPPSAEAIKSAPRAIWVKFKITENEYEALQELFGKDKLSEIGREIFDYFYIREVKTK
jgi:hypothetical protein